MQEATLRILTTTLRILALLIWFGAVLVFLQTITIEMHERSVERSALELSESLYQSNLTLGRAVFSRDELDKYHRSQAEPGARYCNFGYHLSFEDLDNHYKWDFGYIPEQEPEIEYAKYSLAVGISDGNYVHPAKMSRGYKSEMDP